MARATAPMDRARIAGATPAITGETVCARFPWRRRNRSLPGPVRCRPDGRAGAPARWPPPWGYRRRTCGGSGISTVSVRTFKLSKDPPFEQKFQEVIGWRLDPPEKALVSCCDKKPPWQALECMQPGSPLGISHLRTRTHDYGTHKHAKVKAWLEEHLRFHKHFTPDSSSWLNRSSVSSPT